MKTVTAEQYRKMTSGSKYHNVKTKVDGITFDSKAEARRYEELKLLKMAGEILNFKTQPSFRFDSGVRYRPDFIVWNADGTCHVEDVKGMETADFKIKKKTWEHEYPQLPLRVVKG